jgi:hypothetical protein
MWCLYVILLLFSIRFQSFRVENMEVRFVLQYGNTFVCTLSDIFRKRRQLKVVLSGTVTVENSSMYGIETYLYHLLL